MSQSQPHGQGFSSSLTDLMASVAVVFLLLMAVFMLLTTQLVNNLRNRAIELKARAIEADRYDKNRRDSITNTQNLVALLKGLELVKEQKAVVKYAPELDPFLIELVVQEQHLSFQSGECNLQQPTEARRLLRPVFDRVCGEQASVQSITLEGHTSKKGFCPAAVKCGAVPCRAQAWKQDGFANNVRLSAARAQNVYLEMRAAFEENDSLRKCLDGQFVVAGRGPVQPASGSEWDDPEREEDQPVDRRVVLKVRMKSELQTSQAQ